MITKFDSLYAGHVDMENVGYGGVAVNDRSFPNEHLVTVFDKTEAIAKTLDRLGFDTFWLAEHHFQPGGVRVHPEHPHGRRSPGARYPESQAGLRLQHRPDVAPVAARRGLRDRRHPD